jgi:hypothetical protein
MKFYPVGYHFLLVSAIFLSTLLSKTLSPYYSFKVRNQDSQPYKINCKIIVTHFSIFVFLDCSPEYERLWEEWEQTFSESSLLLISPCMQF